MIDVEKIKKRIITDVRIELTDEFDRNFERKAFFTKKWQKRKDPNALGSLLLVTGTLRRSIQSKEVENGVQFTSNVPYATIHNEGGKGSVAVKAHTRKGKKGKRHKVKKHMRKVNMPQRQFVGNGDKTQRIIKAVIDDNIKELSQELGIQIKKDRNILK